MKIVIGLLTLATSLLISFIGPMTALAHEGHHHGEHTQVAKNAEANETTATT